MDAHPDDSAITAVVCNEDLWYFRLGSRLGLYRAELTHSAVDGGTMAVPRSELGYWRARLGELRAGGLAHGAARGLFVHDSVHARQMRGQPFWLWGLRYVLDRRFRRRIEQEAYTVHLVYLARCGLTLERSYWAGRFEKLYFGAFDESAALRLFDRIASAVRAAVPGARIVGHVERSDAAPPCAPWLANAGAASGREARR